MYVHDAVRGMIAVSGQSASGVSQKMGKTRGLLNTIIARKTDMRISTLVKIAELTGFEIVARNADSGAEFVITADQ